MVMYEEKASSAVRAMVRIPLRGVDSPVPPMGKPPPGIKRRPFGCLYQVAGVDSPVPPVGKPPPGIKRRSCERLDQVAGGGLEPPTSRL